MRKRRQIEVFSISFLDLLSGALGAVIILYVAIPKNKKPVEEPKQDIVKEILKKDLASSREKIEALKKELEETKESSQPFPFPRKTEHPRRLLPAQKHLRWVLNSKVKILFLSLILLIQ